MTKRKEHSTESFADLILSQADRVVTLARLKLSLVASKQRLDRAYLAFGEYVAELLENQTFDLNHPEVQYRLELIKRLKEDCLRIEKKIKEDV